MKYFFLFFLFLPMSIFSMNGKDTTGYINKSEITRLENEITLTKKELVEVSSKLEAQANLNERVINSISTQLDAASYNITIFGVLFAIAAILLGIYVTRIENKVVRIKEENTKLLSETIKNKEEVVAINNLIQNDILGLFLKIKREETNHILNRLLTVPKDISNLIDQLLSRELEKEDFEILKKAYITLLKLPEKQRGQCGLGVTYEGNYKLLFFQHFLDLSIKDDIIGKEIVEYIPHGIACAFENDIIKSTNDFMKVLIESGYKTKVKEINNYIKGLSTSNFKDSEQIYQIIFDKLKNREWQFDLFNLISEDKEYRIGKSNYGKLLISSYSNTELNDIEKSVIDKTNAIIAELKKEEEAQKLLEQKRVETEEAKKNQQAQIAANKKSK